LILLDVFPVLGLVALPAAVLPDARLTLAVDLLATLAVRVL